MELICSIGPGVRDFYQFKSFVDAGMTMPRFNFSHINYEFYNSIMPIIKREYPSMKVIQDLQGNKLRVSRLYGREDRVYAGDKVIFCLESDYYKVLDLYKWGNVKVVPILYSGKISDFKNVSKIYMKDATMEFEVINKSELLIQTLTLKGGVVRGEKGVNAPGLSRDNLHLTEKDKYDVIEGLKSGVDIICLSYVMSARDIVELKEFINTNRTIHNISYMPEIWAKIECREGIKNILEISEVCDCIMLGRGDLRAETSLEEIPLIQKTVINELSKVEKPLIIATNILESMKKSNVPTLAEVSCIYDMVRSGVTGIMLCSEVSITKDAVNIVEYLNVLLKYYLGIS